MSTDELACIMTGMGRGSRFPQQGEKPLCTSGDEIVHTAVLTSLLGSTPRPVTEIRF